MVKRLSVDKLKELTLDSYRESKKQNLILTGSRDIGKTTLFNELLKTLPDYSGFITYLKIDESGRSICFKEIGSDEVFTAAIMVDGEMVVKDDFFDTTANDMFRSHLNNSKSYFVFDEIGYVERNSEQFLETLKEIFRQKTVIATMRKDRNAIYNCDEIIDNSHIVDLDLFT
ncbi:MAG: nucleoside-triphosphatase [Tissierellia bacterium]|nr:nucleoside-triphosphatase [Tissierellia bacterium]